MLYDGVETEVRILDMETRKSRTIPGSQHMYSPRWSPDRRHITAVSDDTSKLFLYTFDTRRWKAVSSSNGVGWPAWSRDSRYLYVLGSAIYRIRVDDGSAEIVAKLDGIELGSAGR